jgi:hypothetical protein
MSTKHLGRRTYIAKFFAPPTMRQSQALLGDTLSSLYLLRKEAQDCLINKDADQFEYVAEETVFGAYQELERLWASTMVVFAGLDLLGKFASGDDSQYRVGERFIEYMVIYGGLKKRDASILYVIRNAIMHSFGLYDRKKGLRRPFAMTQNCELPRNDRRCIRRVGRHWSLCVEHLYDSFVYSIQSYESALAKSMKLKKGFTKMYHRYGYTSVSW